MNTSTTSRSPSTLPSPPKTSPYSALAQVPLSLTLSVPDNSARIALPDNYHHGIPHNVTELYTVDIETVETILAYVLNERETRNLELDTRRARLLSNNAKTGSSSAELLQKAIGSDLSLSCREKRQSASTSASGSLQNMSSASGLLSLSTIKPSASIDRALLHQATMKAKLKAQGLWSLAMKKTKAPASGTPILTSILPSSVVSELASLNPFASSQSSPQAPNIPPKPEPVAKRPSLPPSIRKYVDMGFAQEGVEFIINKFGEDGTVTVDYCFLYTELRRTFPHAVAIEAIGYPSSFKTAADATPFLQDFQRLLEFGFAPSNIKKALLKGKTFEAALELLMSNSNDDRS